MLVRHNFPLDAEYQIQAGAGRVDLTIDGMPVPTGLRRILVPAGPHTIGLANVPAFNSGGLDGVFSAPPPRARDMSITITGPFLTSGPGSTPSRRRIFVCQPRVQRRNSHAPVKSSPNLQPTRTGAALSMTIHRSRRCSAFIRKAETRGTFETGIQNALARLLVDPQFVFRMEAVPAKLPNGSNYRLSDVELASRLSFFCGAAFPTTRF
jgi:hypothetical protein